MDIEIQTIEDIIKKKIDEYSYIQKDETQTQNWLGINMD